MSQMHHRYSHRDIRQADQRRRHTRQRSPLPEFGCTLFYLPSVMDSLSVELGHTAGHFDSVKSRICQVYQLLIEALGRHDPLPWMVRDAVESVALAPPPIMLSQTPQQQHQQTQGPARSAGPGRGPSPNTDASNSRRHSQRFNDKLPPPHSRSDIETITAMDIPYTLRHFDFDVTAAVNIVNSDGNSRRGTSSRTGGTVSFSLSEAAPTSCTVAENHVSFDENSRRDSSRLAAGCRAIADVLLTRRLASIVGRAVGAEARKRIECSVCETSGTPAGTYAPHNSAASSPAKSAVSTTSSRTSSPSAIPSSRSAASVRGDVRKRHGSRSPTAAPGSLSATLAMMDGSNSNRATNTLVSNGLSQAQAASMAAPSEFGGSVSSVGFGGVGGGSGVGTGRLCAMHTERAGGLASESSCAVCASQHFLQRHLQRLAQEPGGAGLARLEDALCDTLQLQEQWRRSVRWVASCVKDNRLPESIRPLVHCIGASAEASWSVGCGNSDNEMSLGRGVTVNPQIIISTDGHCSALKCSKTAGSSSCCWDAPSTLARDAK